MDVYTMYVGHNAKWLHTSRHQFVTNWTNLSCFVSSIYSIDNLLCSHFLKMQYVQILNVT